MKKILIVEDDQFLVKAYQAKFSHVKNVKIDIAYDGIEALAILRDSKHDAMILDLALPKLDGFGILEIINKEKIVIPTLVASNLGSENDIRRAMDLGAKSYFIKSNTSIKEIIDETMRVMK